MVSDVVDKHSILKSSVMEMVKNGGWYVSCLWAGDLMERLREKVMYLFGV